MSKKTTDKKKLAVKTEKLRKISNDKLGEVNGGAMGVRTWACPTQPPGGTGP